MSGQSIILSGDIGIAHVADLRDRLLQERGDPLTVDVSDVNRIGGLGLQVLLSAAKTWSADGMPFAIINPSEGFRSAMILTAATLPEARA